MRRLGYWQKATPTTRTVRDNKATSYLITTTGLYAIVSHQAALKHIAYYCVIQIQLKIFYYKIINKEPRKKVDVKGS